MPEAVFGDIKQNHGFKRFKLKSNTKVKVDYHKTPADWFREHPEARPREEDWRQATDWLKREQSRGVPGTRHAICPDEAGTRSQTPICELPAEIVAKTLKNVPKSTLQEFLETISPPALSSAYGPITASE